MEHWETRESGREFSPKVRPGKWSHVERLQLDQPRPPRTRPLLTLCSLLSEFTAAQGVVCHSPSLSSLQCEHLVGLLLDTAVVSMPSSGGSQRNIISFSHGQYFYSLFSETINTELLKNLDVAVLELMKSSVDNPKMVMDFSF